MVRKVDATRAVEAVWQDIAQLFAEEGLAA
jgi:hypothetical protein